MMKWILRGCTGVFVFWFTLSNAANCTCFQRGDWQGNNSYYRCAQHTCEIAYLPDGGGVWAVENTVNLNTQGINYTEQTDGGIACPKAYRHANPATYAQCRNNKITAAVRDERNGLPQCKFHKDWKLNSDGEYVCALNNTSTIYCSYNAVTNLTLRGDTVMQFGCNALQEKASAASCADCYHPI